MIIFYMQALKNKLNIDDTFTKPIKKPKKFTKVSDVVTLIEDYNFMADILHLPETEKGFKYLLVIVDLATHEFDIQPLKTKSSKEALTAMKKIFSRKHIKKPKASIRTDNGTEFKDEFDKFLKNNKIFHSVSLPYRHTQMSMVESLNRQLGDLFNGYMNLKERETGKEYKEWIDIIDIVRTELNKIRKVKAPYNEKTIFNHVDKPMNLSKDPKFKVGDIVHYYLDYPENALGHKQPTDKFRTGDYRWSAVPKKIKQVLYYSGNVPYRYVLDYMPTVSFTEEQLKKSEETQDKYKVKKIIGERTKNKQKEYLVWWDKYLKSEATYEPEKQLLEDGLKSYIDDFKKNKKKN